MTYIKKGRNRTINPLVSYEGRPCRRCGNTRRYNKKNRCTVCAQNWVAQSINVKVKKLRLERVGSPCDICGTTMDKPVFDHSHMNGGFRGWLCNPCNFGLGQFRDSVELLKNAVEYLSK